MCHTEKSRFQSQNTITSTITNTVKEKVYNADTFYSDLLRTCVHKTNGYFD